MLRYSVQQHLCSAYAGLRAGKDRRRSIADRREDGPQSPHCVVPFAGDVLSFAEMESLAGLLLQKKKGF